MRIPNTECMMKKKKPKVVKVSTPKSGGWPIRFDVRDVRLVGDPAPYISSPSK